MSRNHLVLVGFFILFTAQNTLLIGYLRFHTKGYEIVNVQGTSMFPTLKNGQKAIINYNIPEANLTNMIIVFSNTRICHRCIKDEGQWLTFKGDNASTFEHATRNELKAIFIKITQDPFLDSLLLGLQ
jgi:signal peptidase I